MTLWLHIINNVVVYIYLVFIYAISVKPKENTLWDRVLLDARYDICSAWFH